MKQRLYDIFSIIDIDLLSQYLNIYTIVTLCVMYFINYKWKRINIKSTKGYLLANLWLLFLLPGTIVHELMHLFVGFFLKAKPRGFSIFPKKSDNGDYVLGSVEFAGMNFFNAMPTSMAPFLMLPLSLFVLIYFNTSLLSSPESKILSGYILYNLVTSSIPSITDFKLLFKFPMTIVFYAIIFYSFYKIL